MSDRTIARNLLIEQSGAGDDVRVTLSLPAPRNAGPGGETTIAARRSRIVPWFVVTQIAARLAKADAPKPLTIDPASFPKPAAEEDVAARHPVYPYAALFPTPWHPGAGSRSCGR
jgi:hypothetical protein